MKVISAETTRQVILELTEEDIIRLKAAKQTIDSMGTAMTTAQTRALDTAFLVLGLLLGDVKDRDDSSTD